MVPLCALVACCVAAAACFRCSALLPSGRPGCHGVPFQLGRTHHHMAFILPFKGVPNAYCQCDYQWSYYYADTGVVTL